jgi:hypothetical protein
MKLICLPTFSFHHQVVSLLWLTAFPACLG